MFARETNNSSRLIRCHFNFVPLTRQSKLWYFVLDIVRNILICKTDIILFTYSYPRPKLHNVPLHQF